MRDGDDPPTHVPRTGRRSPWLRVPLALGLLLGPTVAAEHWVWTHPERVYPALKARGSWADAKLMFFDRVECPEAISLGSSMTYEVLFHRHLTAAGFEPKIESSFNFGLSSNKLPVVYGTWREIQRRGCQPKWVFLEVSPSLVSRGRQVVRRFLPSVFSVGVWRRLPPAVFAYTGLTWRDVAEMQTWDALVLSRRREELVGYAIDVARGEKSKSNKKVPQHGELRGPSKKRLTRRRLAKEKARRAKQIRKGTFNYAIEFANVTLLRMLVDEIVASGARVVLHTPPATSMYHDALVTVDARDDWCRLEEEIERTIDAPWFNEFDGVGYENRLFKNWDHVNVWGAERYVQEMAEATRTGEFGEDTYCE